MNNNFPKLEMANFTNKFLAQDLVSMHNTNPEPFTQSELEHTIGMSFSNMLKDVELGFAPDAGTNALRHTLAKYHYESIDPSEVVTHAGAQEALFCIFSALLQSNDKVLVVAPVFEPLLQIPINIGCDVSFVHLDGNNNWTLNLDEVEAEFKIGCQMFVINFPHNPTGATLTESMLNKLIVLCKKYDVWLLSDEVFRGLEHSLNYRLPAVADLYKKGISVGVISKAFAIPGIRVGWLACKNKQLREKVVDIKGYISICNSQIDEKLAAIILRKPEKLCKRHIKIILKNKELLVNFNSISNTHIDIIVPNVGCCAFAQINGLITSTELVNKIAKETGYLLYPSLVFKTNVEGLRIGFGGNGFFKFITAQAS